MIKVKVKNWEFVMDSDDSEEGMVRGNIYILDSDYKFLDGILITTSAIKAKNGNIIIVKPGFPDSEFIYILENISEGFNEYLLSNKTTIDEYIDFGYIPEEILNLCKEEWKKL